MGIILNNQFLSKRLSVYAGYFYPTDAVEKYLGNKYHLTFRLVGLPVYKVEADNYKVFHVDAGFTYEYHDFEEVSYSLRPESHLAPKYLKINVDETKSVNEYNAGMVLVFNQLSLEGEYTFANLLTGPNSAYEHANYSASSYYGTIAWFITGEHKNYSKSKVAFDRLSPKKNFGANGGLGAWEIAFRYSYINVNDRDLQGGKMNDITVGLNWYLNPITKIALNYVRSDIDKLGIANIYQMRFQITF
ncbi:MAG: hypothetical protein C0598_09320 [Marinilabiliales bacterium]|nr:MAG: hypothetical protein C0598_09320 [Marinilabiliales bacterium]